MQKERIKSILLCVVIITSVVSSLAYLVCKNTNKEISKPVIQSVVQEIKKVEEINETNETNEINETEVIDIIDVIDEIKQIKYQLHVHTTPTDTKIQILNIKQQFHQGISLNSGKYHIQITKKAYTTIDKWIVIADVNKTININLQKIVPKKAIKKERLEKPTKRKKYRININVFPTDATIEISNIKTKFYQGIALISGEYRIIVSKKGYKNVETPIYIRNSNIKMHINLQKIPEHSIHKQQKVKQSSNKVSIPDNATLNSDGNSWSCDDGYLKVGNDCYE